MAKFMGIDYGSKRVGVAISDDSGSIAFPKEIITNDRALLPRIIDLVRDQNVSVVVVGESKDKDGKENLIMAEVKAFVLSIQEVLSVSVFFEPEYYSSFEARRDSADEFVDAKAAAIILNRYLERAKN